MRDSNICPTDELILSTEQSNLNSVDHLKIITTLKILKIIKTNTNDHFAIIWPVLIVMGGFKDKELRGNGLIFLSSKKNLSIFLSPIQIRDTNLKNFRQFAKIFILKEKQCTLNLISHRNPKIKVLMLLLSGRNIT